MTDSTYRNILSRNVVKLQEKGKLTQLKNKWWKQKRGGGACSSSDIAGEAKKLSLDNTGGVFVVLLGGCIFAISVAFFEFVWSIYKRESKTSFKEEFKEELKFIMKCRGTVKEVRKPSMSYSDSGKDSNSISKSSSFI